VFTSYAVLRRGTWHCSIYEATSAYADLLTRRHSSRARADQLTKQLLMCCMGLRDI